MTGANQFLPIALGIVMLSLGLALTLADFRRVMLYPRAVIIALFCQTLLLPLICFFLVRAFRLPPELAVGLMLLAASPGGAVANVFSHLADGDLALNITLTAVNSVLSIVTLPLIVMASLAYFAGDLETIPLQYGKVIQVFAIIVGPVAIGMALRWRFPALADRLSKPVKIMAGVFLFIFAVIAIVGAWDTLRQHIDVLGLVVSLFCLISLSVGYLAPRLVRLDHRQSIAISAEIGMHNGALAIAIALSPALNSPAMAVSPLLYAVLSVPITAAFLFVTVRLRAIRGAGAIDSMRGRSM